MKKPSVEALGNLTFHSASQFRYYEFLDGSTFKQNQGNGLAIYDL